jgi:hypothetical protein
MSCQAALIVGKRLPRRHNLVGPDRAMAGRTDQGG